MLNMNDNGLKLYIYCYPNTVASFVVLINRDTKEFVGKHTAGPKMFMKMDRISI
jgi:hypothetical protein